MKTTIPVHVQYRHVHLSHADREVLFGSEKLTKRSELAHRGQFSTDQTVRVVGPNGVELEAVRVLGPEREETQVELSPTEAFALGIDAPVRLSGDLSRTGSCELIGSNGKATVRYGVIIPARHLHCNERDAAKLGVEHHQLVTLAPVGHPETAIELVSVRVHPTFALSLHLSHDEASEFWVETGDEVILL